MKPILFLHLNNLTGVLFLYGQDNNPDDTSAKSDRCID